MEYLILVAALLLIIVGASLLTDGSVALAERLHVPEFIVGLTIVAIGTSMPELTVSFISAINGESAMAIGNVVGSNTFNVLATLGVCALFSPILFTKSNIRRDIPICIAATIALLVVTTINEDITRLEGVILLMGYIAMIIFTIRADKKRQQPAPQLAEEEPKKQMPIWRIPLWIILGLGGLIWGGRLFVDSATAIARMWGVPESTIAITLVAGGTSVPELASSLVAIFKGRASLALGNVLGSNIANILLILGVCSTITPLEMGSVTSVDVYVTLAATTLVMISALVIGRDKMTRFEGVIFLLCYVAYVYYLVSTTAI
ncbi:MAG: calcium/sodium antiporter [Alistipes sp.]|nr:calcium/sodium antiporter [Alistipes sp.]